MQVELNNLKANFLQAIQQNLNASDVNPEDYDGLIKEFSHFILENHVGSVLYVLDHSAQKYLFVSNNCEQVFGYSKTEILTGGLEFLWNSMHPDDCSLMRNGAMGNSYYEFVKLIPTEQLDRFTFTYNFRIALAKGNYISVLAQTKVLLRSTDKTPMITMGTLADISDYKTDVTMSLKVSHYYPSTKKSKSTLLFVNTQSNIQLSRREIEILKLISKGAQNKRISEELDISIYTVRSHRRSILLKLECDNFKKATIKARAAGLI